MQCPGFADRLQSELRCLVDDMFELRVIKPDDPVSFAWKGGSLLGHSSLYRSHCLTKKHYKETK